MPSPRRSSLAWIAGLLALGLLSACSSGGGNAGSSAASGSGGGRSGAGGAGNPEVTAKAPPVKVTWEALAHERYLYENPRFKRRSVSNVTPDLKIVLVNDSHPEADQIRAGKIASESGTGTGVLSDADMDSLLQALTQIGFFRSGNSTQATSALFDMDTARGRVTVDQTGGSVTILSMRGQGLAQNTKHIPRIYSQAKQAVAMMKNSTPTLRVETIGTSPLAPGR